jgi:chorismate synthase
MVRYILNIVVAMVLVGCVAGMTLAAEEVTVQGTIMKIEGEKVTVKDMEKEQPMKISPATKITSDGKPGSATHLRVGQKVKCLIQRVGDEMMCTSLDVMK